MCPRPLHVSWMGNWMDVLLWNRPVTLNDPAHLNRRDLWQKHVLENLDFYKSGSSFSKHTGTHVCTHMHMHMHTDTSRVAKLICLLKTSVLLLYTIGGGVHKEPPAWTQSWAFLPACSPPYTCLGHSPFSSREPECNQNSFWLLWDLGWMRKKQPGFCPVSSLSCLRFNP